MLTFEEFFLKKKIDLIQLQHAEPALFDEFKKDFEPMGEKSFDHSKKFWFNKLRRAYHIKEEPKPAKTEIELTKVASQAEPLDSPTIEQTAAFKPRFNMKSMAIPQTSNIDEVKSEEKTASPSDAAPAQKPAGFKPRFNMKAVAAQQDSNIEGKRVEMTEETSQTESSSKPVGFKPRFSMKAVAAKQEETGLEKSVKIEENQADDPVPVTKTLGFKPRFSKPKSQE